MKNLFKTILISVSLLILFISEANAVVLNSNFIKKEIEAASVKLLKEKITGDVTVKVINLPYKTIGVPSGKVKFEVDLNTGYVRSKAVARVKIIENGTVIRSFGVPIDIKVEDYVWVATDNIQYGKAFNSENIKLEKKDITNKLKSFAEKDFNCKGFLALKNYRSQEIIDKKYMERVPDVIKNSEVSIIFDSENIKLVIDGEAMENGKIGDYIRVKNKQYNKYYTGKIIDSNQILVKI